MLRVDGGFRAVGDGFDLIWDGQVRLAHRPDRPAFGQASGVPDIEMVRGNFRIGDQRTDLALPPILGITPDSVLFGADAASPELVLRLGGAGARPLLSLEAAGGEVNRLWIALEALPDEHVWGGGEQMSYLCLNGRAFPVWTSEPGVGRDKTTELTRLMDRLGLAGGDYWTTNYPQPTVLTSHGLGLHLRSSAYSVLDFTDPARHRIEVWEGRLDLELFAGSDPADLVRQMADRFGRQPPLPDWAIGGAIIGLKDGARSFERLEAIRAAGTVVTGLWCEDWVGIRETSFGRRLFWDWRWNRDRYPDLPGQIARLKADGIAFLGYVNPYLAVDGTQFAEARDLGLLARRLDGDAPYLVDFGEFDCGVVDFTNPAACDWFEDRVIGREMLDFGLMGWMADFGEYLPVDLRLQDGSDPMLAHNRWPVLWGQVNARALERRGRTGDVVFFMRAGFSGVQACCPLLWAGDQSVDFTRHDGINTVITAALSAGLVGNAYSHSDVGGYTSVHGNVRTGELIQRWAELAAFTPVLRTHEGNRPDENLQIDSDPAILAHFAAMSRVHAALVPYVRAIIAEAAATGLPAQRALFLHYPQERATWTCQDQYLYGRDLLVAPVVEEGAVARGVLLPGTEDWIQVWTGARFAPGVHRIDAPIGSPPVFYRSGSGFAALFDGLAAARDAVGGAGQGG